MYYLRSTAHNLTPDKQRAVRDRIIAGVKIHAKRASFPISEMVLFSCFEEILDLIGVGELQVLDDRGVLGVDQLKALRAPQVAEAKPASKPEPEKLEPTPTLPEDPPDLPVDVIKEGSDTPEPEPEPEPDEDTSQTTTYSRADLEAMTKEQLLEVASEFGIQDKVHHKDLKGVLVKKIWKALK